MTKLKTRIYNSEPQLKDVRSFIQLMINDLKTSYELSIVLMVRNISSQYRQTYLGSLWAVLPAIFTTSIFVYLSNKRVLSIENIEGPYVLYVISGMVLWQVFTDSINSPLNQADKSITMLKKIMFTREALIVAGIGEVLFNFLIRSILLVITFIYYDVQITLQFIFVPIGVMSIVLFGTVIGVLLLPFGLLYRDVGKSLTMLTTLWFFITPVIYSSSNQDVFDLVKYNPVTPLLATTRSLLIGSNEIYTNQFILVTCISILFLGRWLGFI